MIDIFNIPQQRDMLGNRPAAWPTTRAIRGKYYRLPDPIHAGDELVVMSMITWVDFGTDMETLRRGGVAASKQVQELIGEKQILAMQAADFKSRLEAVQEARRKEKRKAAYTETGVLS